MEPKRHGTQNIAGVVSDLDIAVNRLGDTDHLNAVVKHFLG